MLLAVDRGGGGGLLRAPGGGGGGGLLGGSGRFLGGPGGGGGGGGRTIVCVDVILVCERSMWCNRTVGVNLKKVCCCVSKYGFLMSFAAIVGFMDGEKNSPPKGVV